MIKSKRLAFGGYSTNAKSKTDIESIFTIDRFSTINAINEFSKGSVNRLPSDRDWYSIEWTNFYQSLSDLSAITSFTNTRANEIGLWIKRNLYNYYAFCERGFNGLDSEITMPGELIKVLGLDFLADCVLSQNVPGSYDVKFDGKQKIHFPELSFDLWYSYYSHLTDEDHLRVFLSKITQDTNIGDDIIWQCRRNDDTYIYYETVQTTSYPMRVRAGYERALELSASFEHDYEYLGLISGFQITTNSETDELESVVFTHRSGFTWWHTFGFYIAADVWPLSTVLDMKLPKFTEPEIGIVRNFFTISNLSDSRNADSFYYISARYAAAHLVGEKVARMIEGLDQEWLEYQESLPSDKRLTISVSTFRSLFLEPYSAYSAWYNIIQNSTLFGETSGYLFPDIHLNLSSPDEYFAPGEIMAGGISGMSPLLGAGVGMSSEWIYKRLGLRDTPVSETEYLLRLTKFETTLKKLLSLIAKFYLFGIGQQDHFILKDNGYRLAFCEKLPPQIEFNAEEHFDIDGEIFSKPLSNNYVFSRITHWDDITYRDGLVNDSGYYPTILQYSDNDITSFVKLFWHLEVCSRYCRFGGDRFFVQPTIIGTDASSKLMRIQTKLTETISDVEYNMTGIDNVLKDVSNRLSVVEDDLRSLKEITSDFPVRQQEIIDELQYSTPILEATITELLRLVDLAEGTSGLATIADYVQSVKTSVLSHYELSTEEVRRLSRVLTFLGDNIEGDLTSIPVMVSSEVERLQILIKRMESTIANRLDQLPTKADNQKATATNFLSSAILGLR